MAEIQKYSVSEFTSKLQRTVEGEYGAVQIEGEISNFIRPASGHLYFQLKDNNSVIKAVCWRFTASRMAELPRDGQKVICTGKVTIYSGSSHYQIICDRIEPAGQGALMERLLKLKKQLSEEGLFASDNKQAIPFMPRKIGVITSPTGAVIRDIIHRIKERFPCNVELYPVRVQGEGSKEEIVKALQAFEKMADKPDVIILARGGGSIEDLWSFNEEIVVRAVAAATIPIISAVGHETDTTLVDYAADLRAPTPTAAAEKATPNILDLISTVDGYRARLRSVIVNILNEKYRYMVALARGLSSPVIEHRMQRLDDMSMMLSRAMRSNLVGKYHNLQEISAQLPSPQEYINSQDTRLGNASLRLQNIMPARLENASLRLQNMSKLLDSYGVAGTLKRGFSLVRGEDGKLISSTDKLQKDNKLEIEFANGKINAYVNDIK